jgi:hypothetical protein
MAYMEVNMAHSEIQIAKQFLLSCLYGKLPRRRVDLFGEELERSMKNKFQGHWYMEAPMKGSAFRCLHFTSKEVDPVFHQAADSSGVPFNEISAHIPAELRIWVDPGEVSYQIGEKGTVSILYRRNQQGQEEFGADIDQQEYARNSGLKPQFTVAEFMSTKFGSMKNRNNRRQNNNQPGGPQQHHQGGHTQVQNQGAAAELQGAAALHHQHHQIAHQQQQQQMQQIQQNQYQQQVRLYQQNQQSINQSRAMGQSRANQFINQSINQNGLRSIEQPGRSSLGSTPSPPLQYSVPQPQTLQQQQLLQQQLLLNAIALQNIQFPIGGISDLTAAKPRQQQAHV